MYDMMKGMASAARLGADGAAPMNMQRNVRGRFEAFDIEPLTLAATNRRSGARLAAAGRSGARCSGPLPRSARTM